jgi:regulatory protein
VFQTGANGRPNRSIGADGGDGARLCRALRHQRGKLAAYLARKLRERGWDGASPPDVDGLVARFVRAGYVDDAGYARAKAQGLLRRGYGARRIDQALGHAGIAEDMRAEARGSERDRRHAALVMARKRRFGPWGEDRERTDRRSIRPGANGRSPRCCAPGTLAYARRLVDEPSIEAAEEWVDEILD